MTPCFVNGDPLHATPGLAASADVLVRFPYTNPTTNTYLAQGNEIGATYGVAYHRTAKKVFVSAVQRRHMGYGPMGTGGIYMVDPNTNVVTQFLNLNQAPINTGTDPHSGLPNGDVSPSNDAASFDAVGKISLGDMDISDDEKSLWVMNVNQQTLLQVPLGGTSVAPTAPAIGNVVAYAWPTPCGSTSVFRAWGVEFHQGKVYIAGVCSEENAGGSANNMRVYIYELDPTASSPAFSLVTDFGGLVHTRGVAIDAGSQSGTWNRWSSTFSPTGGPSGPNNYVSLPQPIVSDLEFDESGNLILGFMDRWGMQSGFNNYPTTGTTLRSGATAGDIVRLCRSGSTYILEGNAGCAQNYTTAGYNGGEFYNDPTTFTTALNPTTSIRHGEATQGGLAYNRVANTVASTFTDPESADSGGLVWLSNSNGAQTDKYQVFNGTVTEIGKAAGLGDLELLADPTALEVGNFVWTDTDSDGIQDPGEGGIDGLTVTLWKDDGAGNFSQIASTTTTGGGRYGFSNAATGSGTGVAYNVAMLLPNMNYQIRVASGQAPISTLSITDDNSAASGNDATNNNKTDQRDSDANISGVIAFSTGGYGQNNYTLDIGYAPAATCAITVTSAVPTACNPATNQYDLTVTVNYANPPAGNIILGIGEGVRTQFAFMPDGTSPDTYTITGLSANNVQNLDVEASFANTPSCTNILTDAYDAPESCGNYCVGNLIQNPSFEITNTNVTPPPIGVEFIPASWVAPARAYADLDWLRPDGIGHIGLYGTGTSVAYQNVPVTVGNAYTLTLYSAMHFPLVNSGTATLQYYDASDVPIGVGDVHTVTHDWEDDHGFGGLYSISLGAAPANASYVRITLENNDPTAVGESVKFDALCLSATPLCNITSAGATLTCNDNGTGTPTDDYYTISTNPSGTGVGTQYNVTVVHNGNTTNYGPYNYGSASAAFGNFLISQGNAQVTITDATMGTCSLGPVTVSAPAYCSPCYLTIDAVTASACDPLTDNYSLEVTVTYGNAPSGGIVITPAGMSGQSFTPAVCG